MARDMKEGNSELFRAVWRNPAGAVRSIEGPYITPGAAAARITHYLWWAEQNGYTGAVETTATKWAPVGAEPLPAPQTPLHSFTEWPKTPRLFRSITVTEKIDGTNAAIAVRPATGLADAQRGESIGVRIGDEWWAVFAQSRNRIITPGADNYGFARWVWDNAHALVETLGAGVHYGEWWGSGIQRRYELNHKRFSLFNTDKHADLDEVIGGVPVSAVPVLYRGPMDTAKVDECLRSLAAYGSVAAPGFANPEGICVYHHASRKVFKATLDANDAGKWEAATP
jgi:hypothetical protein